MEYPDLKMNRRRFLAIMSAAAAFTNTSCRNYKDKGEIIPYVNKPEEITPGIANYYASACSSCSQGCGILVKTREGRPVKIDGNPEHPVNKGKICASGQAAVYNLYDPARLKAPVSLKGNTRKNISWNQADQSIVSGFDQAVRSGREIAIISHPLYSPSELGVMEEFKNKYPTARFYYYDFYEEGGRLAAWQNTYGRNVVPAIQFADADVIVALESDFLGSDSQHVMNTISYAGSRDVVKRKSSSRLYAVEGGLSMTGMSADYRIPLRPDAIEEFVNLLTAGLSGNGSLSAGMTEFIRTHKLDGGSIGSLLKDLRNNKGRAVVYAGDVLPQNVHTAVNRLNDIISASALYTEKYAPVTHTNLASAEDIAALAGRMNGGQVGAVIIYDSNPVYHFPGDIGFARAVKRVPLRVSLTEMENETSVLCSYVLPLNHMLESWGDLNSHNNVFTLKQPVIAPLFNTRQREAVMLSWTATDTGYNDQLYLNYLKQLWRSDIFPGAVSAGGEFQSFWNKSLHDGFFELSGQTVTALPAAVKSAAAGASASHAAETKGYCLHIKQNAFLSDGRFANNGWLQELPHPVSKIVWDNYAAMSSETARELGVNNNDLIEITSGARKQKFPVFIQYGTADKVIVVEAGYGRWETGDVGKMVGSNPNILIRNTGSFSRRIISGISAKKIAGSHELVATQEHYKLDDDLLKDIHLRRKIIREGTLDQYRKDENFLPEKVRNHQSVNEDVVYNEVKWGMSIDLNKCIGCSACIVSCDVENNIPVVGRDQVKDGREMHWLRIDRYYSGDENNPDVSLQPMLCQHCDTAPCENVCPVAATTHSPDGLNQMAYNRCVGTRYCSNNCPYKVRRFNFFNFRDHFADGYYDNELVELGRNPEVTVRSRGVMEKCTFCIQRIMQAREDAKEEGRLVRGSDVVTACQQACPSQAIEFGDLNDKTSEVTKMHKHPLGYYVLEDLNTRPNIVYMARLRNKEI
ncbi:MAG: 4Fe-4S dicluster domain-containing protein [Bacteroidota bacterium]